MTAQRLRRFARVGVRCPWCGLCPHQGHLTPRASRRRRRGVLSSYLCQMFDASLISSVIDEAFPCHEMYSQLEGKLFPRGRDCSLLWKLFTNGRASRDVARRRTPGWKRLFSVRPFQSSRSTSLYTAEENERSHIPHGKARRCRRELSTLYPQFFHQISCNR